MENNKTLLVIAPGQSVGMEDKAYHLLVAETGEHLFSHVCSHSSYAYGDLYSNRQERIEELSNRFGEVEVKFINETGLTEDELMERNSNWYLKAKQNEDTNKS